jgi:hypothetical protein
VTRYSGDEETLNAGQRGAGVETVGFSVENPFFDLFWTALK